MTGKSSARAPERAPERRPERRESTPEKTPLIGRARPGAAPPPTGLARRAGNRAVGRMLTPPRPAAPAAGAVRVGAAGDGMEREADAVADAVMSARPGTVKAGGAAGETRPATTPRIMRAGGRSGGAVGAGFTSAMRGLGPGKPLARSARSFLEPRFGADLGHVRVQSGPDASALARSISAKAFTYRDTIVMGEGQYRPGTGAGRRLLAHEIAHTFQQGAPIKRTFDGASAVDGIRRGGGPVIQRELFSESKTARAEGLKLLDDLREGRWLAALHKYKDQKIHYEETEGLGHQKWVKWFRGTSGKLNTARTEAKALMGKSTDEKKKEGHLTKVSKVAGDAKSADFDHFWGTNHQHSAGMVRKIAWYLVHALPQATLHAAIEDEMLDAAPKAQKNPIAVLMMGGSGSGKSRVKALEGVKVDGMVDVDADAVKAALPTYLDMVHKGDEQAAWNHHNESQDVAASAVTKAIASRQHLLYDATGANRNTYLGGYGLFDSDGLFKMLKKQGYEIRVVMVYVPEELAWQRVKSRAKETGRHIPEDVTRRIHGEATRYFLGTWAGHRDVDKASIYENMGKDPMLVWRKESPGAIGDTEKTKIKERLGLLSETEYTTKFEARRGGFEFLSGTDGVRQARGWAGSQDSEAGKLAAKHGLTVAEMAAIYAYTAEDFRYMNPTLANNMTWLEGAMGPMATTAAKQQKAREEGWAHARFAIKGLKKLPDWQGTTYRGAGFKEEDIAKHFPVGGTIEMEAFKSSSTNIATAAHFASTNTGKDEVSVINRLQLTKGKDIKALSRSPKEEEIMIMPFSTFRVQRVRDRTATGGFRYKEIQMQQQT